MNPITTKEKADVSRATKFESQYGEYMQIAKDNLQKRYKLEWSANDSVAFGEYAQTWEAYIPSFESDMTSRNELGPALTSGLGVVAMSYGNLPIQPLASIQPIPDESANIYYRKGVAETSRGGINAGDELVGAFGGTNQKTADYLTESGIVNLTVTDNAGSPSAGPYASNLGKNVNPGKFKISVAGGKIKGFDDGEGHILGVGIDAEASTINYTTGAVSIKLINPAAKDISVGDAMDLVFSNNLVDGADTVPTLKWTLVPKTVQVDYFIIQSSFSAISDFVVKKRFGTDLADEISADMVSQVNAGVMHKAISELRKAAVENETLTGVQISWNGTAPTAVADVDYRQTFDDVLIDATDAMYKMAGRGDVNFIIVGKKGKQILKTMGMKTIQSGVAGPHLCGYHDETVPVYYAPNTVIADGDVIVGYRGSNWYESPMVYAPFLPLTSVSGSVRENVFSQHVGTFHSAAIEVVVNGFVQRIKIL